VLQQKQAKRTIAMRIAGAAAEMISFRKKSRQRPVWLPID
jgi:hypothetical protein